MSLVFQVLPEDIFDLISNGTLNTYSLYIKQAQEQYNEVGRTGLEYITVSAMSVSSDEKLSYDVRFEEYYDKLLKSESECAYIETGYEITSFHKHKILNVDEIQQKIEEQRKQLKDLGFTEVNLYIIPN